MSTLRQSIGTLSAVIALGAGMLTGSAGVAGLVAGLVVAPDGSLLVSDESNGVIYRNSHAE